MMALLARKNPHFSQVVAVDAGFDPCLDCLVRLIFLFASTLLLRVCTVDLGEGFMHGLFCVFFQRGFFLHGFWCVP